MSTVAVVGGGLAGMTAAVRLTDAGHQVRLIERRPYLGGRAYSFVDRETGQEVDNGQHVYLGCCTAYIALLDHLGTLSKTSRQKRLRIEVRSPNGKRGVLRGLPLPAPLHLLPSFLRYPHISWREKLRAIPALLRMQMERHRDRPALRERSFHDWLVANGQSERSIANFWDLVIIPSLNDASRDVSASVGFMLFQETLLKNAHGADVGFASGGLSAIMGDAVQERLAAAGADLLLGRTVERVVLDDAGNVAHVETAGGEQVHADAYAIALPPHRLIEALPDHLRNDPAFAPLASHTFAPIVNLHVWYDRPIGDFDFVAFVDSPVQWVFNRTRIAGLNGPGQYITVSLSGAWEYWPMSKEELRELFIPELARAFPATAAAEVERFVIVKEQRATFRSPPAGPDNRLPQRTKVPNLFLAGDWTDTGWPSTMESAVRSGEAAAAAIAESLSSGSLS